MVGVYQHQKRRSNQLPVTRNEEKDGPTLGQ